MAETDSLKKKTVHGVGWSAADAFLGQGVSFLVGIVLARLLSPAEYGLIGICLIFITVLNGIVDSGFSNALIRKKQISQDDYNTLFLLNIVMSIVLYLVLFFSAEVISSFFHRNELVLLIRIMGLISVINSFSIVQVTILTKKIDFKTKTKSSLISAIVSGIIGIFLAFSGCGVWALVVQQIVKQFLSSLFLWFFNRWTPSIKFNSSSFEYMWGFGWKLMVSGLLNNIWNQLYQVVVGKYYSPYTLGQYTRSNDYANIFSSNITTIVQRVSFPVLSGIQDDQGRLLNVYRRVIKMTMFVTCICMIWMGAMSEPLIYCLVGPQWHDAASYLPLICINMSLYPLHAINLNMLQIQGRSDIFLNLEIIKKIIALFPLAIGVFYNIYWMLISSILVGFISLYLNTFYTGKKIGYSTWSQVKDILPYYCIAFFIAFVVYFIKLFPISYWLVLPIQILIGLLLVISIGEILKIDEYKEIKGIIVKVLLK